MGTCLAFIFPEDTDGWFTTCLSLLLIHDARGSRHICGSEGDLISLSSGPRVAEARSQVVDQFLSQTRSEWLLFLDSDMTFTPDLLDRMMEIADPQKIPVLGGLCFAGGRSGRFYPTIYRAKMAEDGTAEVEPVDDYPEDALVKVGATGGACTLIHRTVFLRLSQPWPKGFGTKADGTPNAYPWYSEGLTRPTGEGIGEDIAFALRCQALGIPVHVHTGIRLGHRKRYELTEDLYRERQAKTAAANGSRPERRRAQRELAKR